MAKTASKTEKPDCYRCKWRRGIPGDCHSRCIHPAFDEVGGNDILFDFLSIMLRRGIRASAKPTGITVVGEPYGIRNGWFNHPFNFDPTCLRTCTGFQPKEDQIDDPAGS
jgi:hypothetical protein